MLLFIDILCQIVLRPYIIPELGQKGGRIIELKSNKTHGSSINMIYIEFLYFRV